MYNLDKMLNGRDLSMGHESSSEEEEENGCTKRRKREKRRKKDETEVKPVDSQLIAPILTSLKLHCNLFFRW